MPCPAPVANQAQIMLVRATTEPLLGAARELLREYAHSLPVDVCFQNFDVELAALPGAYAAPTGHLLLAYVDGALAGCGALRALPDTSHANACEMKRLYVRAAFRRFGLGRLLARALLDAARRAGYAAMLLHTLDDMVSARGLYATLGFKAIAPYYDNPVRSEHYLKAELD